MPDKLPLNQNSDPFQRRPIQIGTIVNRGGAA